MTVDFFIQINYLAKDIVFKILCLPHLPSFEFFLNIFLFKKDLILKKIYDAQEGHISKRFLVLYQLLICNVVNSSEVRNLRRRTPVKLH